MSRLGRGYSYDDWHPTKKYLLRDRDEVNSSLDYLGVDIKVNDSLPNDVVIAVAPDGKPVLIKLRDL